MVQCGDWSSLLPFSLSFPSFNVVFIKHLLYAKHCSRLFSCTSSLHLLTNLSRNIYQSNSAPLWFSRVLSWSHHLLSSLVLSLVLPSSSAHHPTNCQPCILFLALSFYPPFFISLLDTAASSRLVSLPPGYQSTHGSVDSPALHKTTWFRLSI